MEKSIQEINKELDTIDASKFVDQSLAIYGSSRYKTMLKNGVSGLEAFKRLSSFCDRTSEVNKNDMKNFFNFRLATEYIARKKIDIFSLSESERNSTLENISSEILKTITGVNPDSIVIKDEDLNQNDMDCEYVLNIDNADLISWINSYFTLTGASKIPCYLRMHSDYNRPYVDSLVVGSNEKSRDIVLKTIMLTDEKLGGKILEPGKFLNTYGNIGYTRVYDGDKRLKDKVYESLIKNIDHILGTESQEISDLDRLEKLTSILNESIKEELVSSMSKELLSIDGLDEEVVIGVEKPSITFEDDLVKEIQNEDASIADEEEKLSDEEINSIIDNSATYEGNNPSERIERAYPYRDLVDNISKLNTKILVDGKEITLLDYLDEVHILDRIPLNSTVVDREGIRMTGEEFLRNRVIPYALEVPNSTLDGIIDAYGAKIQTKSEKASFLGKIFHK